METGVGNSPRFPIHPSGLSCSLEPSLNPPALRGLSSSELLWPLTCLALLRVHIFHFCALQILLEAGSSGQVLWAQAWKPTSQHAREKRGVAGLLLGRTERAARAAELQLCAQAR